MAYVIRLVCPECDAVHRVKSVTLGKLYRCKKCRSGLITMQPAILQCPNCGATTPPTHIEASRLITCEECEKAPLMEVRLPGIVYPKTINYETGEDIAVKMTVSNVEAEVEGDSEEVVSENFTLDNASEAQVEIEVVGEAERVAEVESEELDENSIFKADTNFIVKGRGLKDGGESEDGGNKNKSLQQLEIFEQEHEEIVHGSAQAGKLSQDDYSSDIFEEQDEVMPDIELAQTLTPEEAAQAGEDYQEQSTYIEKYGTTANNTNRDVAVSEKKRWNWSLPAWVPAVLALLLIGLYGMLYADLDSMRAQLEKSQESIIKQDQSFQEERAKYITLIKSSQDENRKLRSQLLDLRGENDVLRKKSVTFDIPELKED